MRRVADERGATLVELLIAMTLMLVVLGATLSVYDALAGGQSRSMRMNDAQDQARTTVDRLARQLRNLASPSVLTDATTIRPKAVEKATPYDLVFLTVGDTKPATAGNLNDANARRVRYCLDASDPRREVLRMQWQTWTNTASAPQPAPSTTTCPSTDAGWTGSAVVAQGLTNRIGATARPLFLYDSTDVERIARVRTSVFVDPQPEVAPPEASLISSVVLRNQNRVPIADFSIVNGTQVGTLILNGSASNDPENQRLQFAWTIDGSPRAECLAESVTCVTLPLARGADHTITLTVSDPAELRGQTTKTWRVP